MLSMTLEGDEALDARLKNLPLAVQMALSVKAGQLAEALRAYVVQDKLSGQVLNVRTGALRDSIGAEVVEDGDSVLVRLFSRGDVPYAAIQEFGGRTAAHDIAPNKAKALAFLHGGRIVFAKLVHHPGSTIPARSYLGSSLAEMGPWIIDQLKAAVVAAATA